jgi:hypothetical protein
LDSIFHLYTFDLIGGADMFVEEALIKDGNLFQE